MINICESLPKKPGWEEQRAAESLPMDPSVMTPWINTCIAGMVTDDINADIQDDLFLNVNHDWLRDAGFRPGYSTELRLLQAADTVRERCFELLKDKSLVSSPDGETAHDAALVQGMYGLILDWDHRNEEGLEPFKPMVERLTAVKSLDEMTEFLLSEDNYCFGIFPAGVGLSVNSQDSSLYEINISSTGLMAYSDSAEYDKETVSGKRRKEFDDNVFSYMLSRFGIEGEEKQRYMEDAFAFEAGIAPYIKSTLDWASPNAVREAINPVTMEDIASFCDAFPLPEFMEAYGYADSKLINLEEPLWLLAMNELYREESLDMIKAYTLKGMLRGIMNISDEEAFRAYQDYAGQFAGITDNEPDEDIAYETARAYFPYCFDRLYIDRYLSEEMRAEIEKLCRDCIDTYREMLSENEWLSADTIKEAINKLDHMTIHAVYPDKWADDSIYSFASAEEGGSYWKAVKSVMMGSHERTLSRINGVVDKDIWGIDILDTNAYYNAVDNSINIIPGFFCDVSYRSDMSLEEKYGALGTVIGHEISHAFDTKGAQYDAYGNVSNWWTDADYEAFMKRAEKLVRYYDKVVAFDNGIPYRGQLVQTEAIADMAGMKCMLKMAEKEKDFDYEKFFTANAELWARKDTQEAAENAAMFDPHPLHYLRANVCAQQFDEFLDTFEVKEGDGMYLAPEDRIAVW